MRLNYETWKRMCKKEVTKYNDIRYKIDDMEDDLFDDKLWPKSNLTNDTKKLAWDFPYGTIAYNQYCKNDVKRTKEAVTNMNKINNNTTNNHKILNTRDIYAVINGKAYAPEMIRMIRIDQAVPGCEFTITPNPMYAIENTMLSIRDVIFNPPATIVFWGDGSKTVVKCQDGEEFDPEKGLTMAFFKRMHGNKGHYFEEIKKWNNKYVMGLFKDEVHTMRDKEIEKAVEAGMSSSTTQKGVNVEFHAGDWLGILEQIKAFGKFDSSEEK